MDSKGQSVAGGAAVMVANDEGEAFESPDGNTLYRVRSRGIVQRSTVGGPETMVPALEAAATSRYVSVSNKGIYFLSSEHAPWVIHCPETGSYREFLIQPLPFGNRSVSLPRFQSRCTPKPQTLSGIFLKKMPPCTISAEGT
jgi:hypothetical protein